MHISKTTAWHWQQYVSICKTHFSLYSEGIRLNPLALIPAAMVSPSLILEIGKIVICEKLIKNTDLPIHSSAEY